MRYIKLLQALCLLSAFVLLASCGGGTGGGAGGTSNITIAIGGTGQIAVIEQEEKTLFAKLFNFLSPDDALAGTDVPPEPDPDACFIPPDVHRVVFNISGTNMTPINRDIVVNGQCPIIEEFEVPNGSQRIFSADEYNASGAHLYTGATAQDISGADHVQIIMHDADGCDLYVSVDDPKAWDFTEGPSNTCRNSAEPCVTIIRALANTLGDETICVAAGFYDGEYGDEVFPLQLKPGTTLLCQGPNHSSIISSEIFFGPRSIPNETILGAPGALIEGCMVKSDEYSIGINDQGTATTINNSIIDGNDRSETGITLSGNSMVSNSEISNFVIYDSGIHITGGSPTVTHNEIHSNNTGIGIVGGSPTIIFNDITTNGTGIVVDGPNIIGAGTGVQAAVTAPVIDPVITNNTLSCNTRIDLLISGDVNVDARDNLWDHDLPGPFVVIDDVCTFGVDICLNSPATVDFSDAELAPDPCPSDIPQPFFNVSTQVTGLAPTTSITVEFSDNDDNVIDGYSLSDGETVTRSIVGGTIISLRILNVPADQTCTFQTPFSGTTLDDTIASDTVYDILCTPIVEPACGDGVLNTTTEEQCDDGNNVDGDGCSAICTLEPFCGDGNLDPGEECDDGNATDGDGCSAVCSIEVLPEPTCVPTLVSPEPGIVMDNGGPDCQDPMTWSFDWSSCPDEGATYDIQILGGEEPIQASGLTVSRHTFNFPIGIIPDFRLTGWIWQVRATEFGQTGAWSQPRSFTVEPTNTDCTAEPFCGDGYTDPDEDCDDGNTTPGDGCENDCTTTPASECPAPSSVLHDPTGQLGGALNVEINGELWDATFYNQWSLSPRQSYNGDWASDASLALYNLFHTTAFNLYDTNANNVWGCESLSCKMVTPFVGSTTGATNVAGYSFINNVGIDSARVFTSGIVQDQDQTISFVQWSLSDCQ